MKGLYVYIEPDGIYTLCEADEDGVFMLTQESPPLSLDDFLESLLRTMRWRQVNYASQN